MNDLALISSIFAAFAFVWGAVWGSFLNVVIWRLPRGESLSSPPSRCPHCETRIRWHDNLPVAGWILLGGKCRACKASISARYPLVELLVGLLSLAVWWHVARGHLVLDDAGWLDVELLKGVVVQFLVHFYFVALLVAIAFIDLDLTIIPHRLTGAGIMWGLLGALLTHKTGVWVAYFPSVDIVDALIGAVTGGGLILLVFYGYAMLRGIEGGGGGDIWMMAMIGANLGWASIPVVLMLASMQGIVVALIASVVDRSRGRDAGGEGSLLIRGAYTDEYWEGRIGGDGAPPGDARADDAGQHAEAATAPDAGADAPTAHDVSEDGLMKLAVPFGPFLALAAIEYLFVGRALLSWATAGMYP